MTLWLIVKISVKALAIEKGIFFFKLLKEINDFSKRAFILEPKI